MNLNLFYSKKIESYVWLGFPKCSICNKEILNPFVLIKEYNKNNKEISLICYDCIELQKKKERFLYKEEFWISPLIKLPSDALPVLDIPPQLSNCSGLTTIDVAYLPSVETIDNTKHCHNSKFMIMEDSKTPEQAKLELKKKDKLLDCEIDPDKIKDLYEVV